MALSKTFGTNQILTAEDVNEHLVHHVPNPGDPYDTGWLRLDAVNSDFNVNNARVRRIGQVLYFRGYITGSLNANSMTVVASSPLKSEHLAVISTSTSSGVSGIVAHFTAAGNIQLLHTSPIGLTAFFVSGFSGSVVS